jgi:DUF1680 family protein
MPVHQVLANGKVEADRGKAALTRGPIVYCVEGIDNNNHVFDLVIPNETEFQAGYQKNLLGGIVTISGKVKNISGKDRIIRAIPYYAWSHRGPGEMTVWLNRENN